jgi:hypothetical protein
MPHSAESILVVEYLREFESICKTVLAHESGDPGVQFNEKNRGLKISWHVALKDLFKGLCVLFRHKLGSKSLLAIFYKQRTLLYAQVRADEGVIKPRITFIGWNVWMGRDTESSSQHYTTVHQHGSNLFFFLQ